MARGNPKAISLGPGILKLAPLGSTAPADLAAAWDPAWLDLGYTEEGSSFQFETTYEDVTVAEELDPLDSNPTGRSGTVSFAAAEVTVENLKRAMNGGTITPITGPPAAKKFAPPALGTETHVMVGFESEDGMERWVWPLCKQTGATEMQRRKGAAKTTIPMSFRVFKPAGAEPFSAIIDDARTTP